MNTIVIGLGNVLLTDEGLGVRAVEELGRRYLIPESVELLDGGTSAFDLLRPMAGAEHVVIVDALNAAYPPGTLVDLRDEQVPAFFLSKVSPHQVGLSDLLATLRLTDESPERITVIGMVPESLETGVGLTQPVAERLDEMVERVVDELRGAGHHLEPRVEQSNDGAWAGFWAGASGF